MKRVQGPGAHTLWAIALISHNVFSDFSWKEIPLFPTPKLETLSPKPAMDPTLQMPCIVRAAFEPSPVQSAEIRRLCPSLSIRGITSTSLCVSKSVCASASTFRKLSSAPISALTYSDLHNDEDRLALCDAMQKAERFLQIVVKPTVNVCDYP